MQDILDLENETLIHVNDYAAREGISRRTANRYIKIGKIQAKKVKGRTMVIDIPIVQRRIEPVQEKQDRPVEPKPGQLVINQDNYFFRLGELTALARTGHRWQILAIVSIVLLFIALITLTGGGIYAWQTITVQKGRLADHALQHSALKDRVIESNSTIETMIARHNSELEGLRESQDKQIEALTNRIVELTSDFK